MIQTIGIANGNRPFANFQFIGVAQGSDRPGPTVSQPHHRQIRDAIQAYHLAFDSLAILKSHGHPCTALHDMGVGKE